MSSINTLLRASARTAATKTASRRTVTPVQSLRRTYADLGNKPPPSQGGSNRNVILGLAFAAVPVLAYLIMREPAVVAPASSTVADHGLDPAERSRARKEAGDDGKPKYTHPEHENPEEFKPPFGQQHKRKRVDGPPDDRNHQSLADRQRQS
ncbi:hypothetical protein F5Y15DRAFT_353834 [Xylariaceae sp. FL0016]|nr:hypothetical protein F5Y15DRAFT_353834 [Xylariaceae sp. FL0016]